MVHLTVSQKILRYLSAASFTYAKNSLLKVFETPTTYNNPNRRRTDRALGTQFGLHALGYFLPADFNPDGTLIAGIATQPWGAVKPGDLRYEDMNADGKINDDDQTVIGNPVTPQIIYGLSPNIRYKGFSLDLLLQGVGKVDWLRVSFENFAFYNGMSAYTENFDYWRPDNLNARYPTNYFCSDNKQPANIILVDLSCWLFKIEDCYTFLYCSAEYYE